MLGYAVSIRYGDKDTYLKRRPVVYQRTCIYWRTDVSVLGTQ